MKHYRCCRRSHCKTVVIVNKSVASAALFCCARGVQKYLLCSNTPTRLSSRRMNLNRCRRSWLGGSVRAARSAGTACSPPVSFVEIAAATTVSRSGTPTTRTGRSSGAATGNTGRASAARHPHYPRMTSRRCSSKPITCSSGTGRRSSRTAKRS